MDIRHALRPQENHLEYLCIDYEEEYYRFYDIKPPSYGTEAKLFRIRPMTSFISFNALKVVKTTALFLETTVHGERTPRSHEISSRPAWWRFIWTTHLSGAMLNFLRICWLGSLHWRFRRWKNLVLETEELFGEKATNVLWTDDEDIAIARLSMVAAAQGVSIHEIKSLVVEKNWRTRSRSSGTDG